MPARDHFLRQLIEFDAALRQRGFQFEARFGQCAATNPRIEEVGRFGQRGRGNAGRQRQYAVFNLTVFADQHHQRAFRLETNEFDMLQPRIGFGGQHDCGGPREAGEPGQRLAERRFDRLRLPDRGQLALDRLPFWFGEIADLHQRVDEEAQAEFRRKAASGSMRRVDQAERFKVRHDVADRSWRQRHRDQARNIARADGLAGRQIALDDLPKNVARPLIELGKPGMRRDQADRIVVGHC